MTKLTVKTKNIVKKALLAIEEEVSAKYSGGVTFDSANVAADYFKLKLANEERENFVVAFLDNQHKLIACETLFKGTIDASAVYPREVVKRALELNANALILSHNHPSGEVNPSSADRRITERLVDALKLVDIKVLDHIIVGHGTTSSFAAMGLI